jgi:hypothetical protein
MNLNLPGPGTKLYIAGPMTGHKDFNFPEFHAASEALRAAGYVVLNPASMHTHTDKPWDWYMKSAITLMMQGDAVFMLRGWTTSRGAKIEWRLAQDIGMATYYQGEA